LTILARRYPLAEVMLSHTTVQGEGAPDEIVLALDRLRAWSAESGEPLDVVIVARGGGSPEDLAPFNDERVARAIFGSPWPVISAVGHETDVTIADFVADVRAPTPSAAAELVAPDLDTLRRSVAELVGRGRTCIDYALAGSRAELRDARDRLAAHSPRAHVGEQRRLVASLAERSRGAMLAELRTLREHVDGRRLQLGALSPEATLARGYGVVSRSGGGVVRSVGDVAPPEALSIRVADGIIVATATDAQPSAVPANGTAAKVRGPAKKRAGAGQ